MLTCDQSPGSGAINPVLRILIVEDNEAAGSGLARLLSAQGYRVTNVTDGAAAIEVLNTGTFQDFLLTDLRLPDLDGCELARTAKDLSPASIIGLMTGWDVDLNRDQLRASGIDWVIPKPIDFKHLLERLRESASSGS